MSARPSVTDDGSSPIKTPTRAGEKYHESLLRIIKEQATMSTINFEAELFRIGSWTLLRLPKSASAQLPSRGMAMVEGTINGSPFKAPLPLEPDGRGSHWLRVDEAIREAA